MSTDTSATPSAPSGAPDRARIDDAVRRLVVSESRLSVDPQSISDSEPLNGPLLKVNSIGFLGMLIRLEEDLDVALPDDLFVGRSFTTVSDLADLVTAAVEGAR
ncbi:acyl carrier protein [Streptomyces xiaopingdaonensis]|uniref:acyl carrier protein n=1 Tax=Streptomyces xiaopingdaonensis TaxID=1565415 RepID=UPI0003084ACE|nr:acyl carrier protein [Streptomyces xiaopingdaonensis]